MRTGTNAATACLAVSLAAPAAAAAEIVINEVRYDPPGADAGGEYVELMNVSSAAVRLEPSWTLERGNGASPGAWVSFWSGDGHELEPGAWLVIGDDPRADRHAVPSLQNGPDACRLSNGGAVTDLVGWGEHAFPEYVETAGAVDAPAGLIARKPDGHDTDDNAADFVSTVRESPGELNFPTRLLVIDVDLVPLEPALPEPGEPFVVSFLLRSEGLEPLPPFVSGARLAGSDVRWTFDAPLVPGGVREGRIAVRPQPRGRYELILEPFGDRVLGASRRVPLAVGLGSVVLSEIQPRARDDEPEWVELDVREDAPAALEGWRLVDASGGWVDLSPIETERHPMVITGARDRMLGRYPAMDPDAVWELALPAINDRDEALHVVGADGRLTDAVVFDAPDAGASLERVNLALPSRDGAAWAPSPFGPTPQRVNGARADPPETPQLRVSPEIVGAHGTEIAFHLGEEAGEVTLLVADVAGRERGRILERTGSARGGVRWDGRLDGERLPPGLYVLVARVETGARLVERRAAFAVDWEGP